MGRIFNHPAGRVLPALLAVLAAAPPLAGGRLPGELLRAGHAERLSQEELKRLFLSGGSTSGSSPAPAPSRPPAQKASPAPPRKPSPAPSPQKRAATPATQPRETPPAPPAAPDPEPRPASKHPTVLVLKEGLSGEESEEDEEEPPPPPPPKKRGFWPFSWGRKDQEAKRWRYLTPALRRELDAIKPRRGRWRYIIVHNSGSRNGNARIFDYYHRRVRKMRNGLAYHFVIGNGSASRMGQIEIGDRWRRQINGGHVASDRMNNIGIGVCLVGDFNKYPPPREQLDALRELVEYLRERAGGRSRGRLVVKGHKEVNPPNRSTDCPGDKFSLQELHRMFD